MPMVSRSSSGCRRWMAHSFSSWFSWSWWHSSASVCPLWVWLTTIIVGSGNINCGRGKSVGVRSEFHALLCGGDASFQEARGAGRGYDGGMFATTRWSLIAAAQDASAPAARQALADLCSAYWFPVYAYVRRRGHDHHAAQDLTQGFFARLLEKKDLAAADRTRGRFRSFLLTACQHFLANQHDHDTAKKRGGGRVHVALDFTSADGRYSHEPADATTPERLFARQWALGLLERV